MTGHSRFSRRDFVRATAGILGSFALGSGCNDHLASPPDPPTLPDPASSGIEHIIVVMMENRSFDHFLGWLPGADGRQAGLRYLDPNGIAHETFPIAPDFQGCAYRDPDHSAAGGRVEYNGGACDGWMNVNDVFSLSYYRQQDLAFLGQAAVDWMTFDRYFCAIMAPTDPNRIYQHAAQTDRMANSTALSTLPTIWDRLAAKGIDGRYYFRNFSVLGRWGSKYQPITRSLDAFYSDCASGALPAVAFVDPPRTGLGAQDDHPFVDVRAGETFLNQVYAAVTAGPGWPHTVLFLNFDEWGGFFDHVPPPVAPIPDADRAAGLSDGLLGFRTPALLISPFARRRYVSHTVYDHTSLLALIEWRWGLQALTVRDATANNPAIDLDFASPNPQAPVYDVPAVATLDCPVQA